MGLCGSAARGDFVDGWSGVDFVAWNLPATSPAATKLDKTVATVSRRYGQRASLHLADAHRRDAHGLGDLYDMKMRAVLRRVGVDTAVIAGVSPTPGVTAEATDLASDIAALRECALVRLASSRDLASGREDTARQVLSALSSAAQLLVTHRDPHASLRLPEVAEACLTGQAAS